MNIKQFVLASIVAGAVAFTAAGQSTTTATAKADHKTTKFIEEASKDNNMEIALADIAAQKGTNPDLKSYAETLKKDHTAAEQKLQPLAQKYGVTLEDPAKIRSSHEVTKFEKEASGTKWDQNFATESLRSHAKDIEKFQEAISKLTNEDVKQYAQTTLPVLRQHFDTAEKVARAVGVDQSTISSYSKKLPPAVGGSSGQ